MRPRPSKAQVPKSRVHYATLSAYNNTLDDDDAEASYEDQPFIGGGELFSPNAPDLSDQLAPVKPRATPYTEYPLRCSVDYAAGTIRCINNESRGGLYDNKVPHAAPVVVFPLGNGTGGGGDGRRARPPIVLSPASPASYEDFNYVVGRNVIAERADSPLNRILTRQALGPWQLVGAAVTDRPRDTSSKDRTMLVYAQSVDSARNRYNYRIVDNNSVPLDVGEKIPWKDDFAPLHVPGYPNEYRLKLYGTFRG